jgi:hypothetical protein
MEWSGAKHVGSSQHSGPLHDGHLPPEKRIYADLEGKWQVLHVLVALYPCGKVVSMRLYPGPANAFLSKTIVGLSMPIFLRTNPVLTTPINYRV